MIIIVKLNVLRFHTIHSRLSVTPRTSLCNKLFEFIAITPNLQGTTIFLDILSASKVCVNWQPPVNRNEYIFLHYEVTLSGFPLRTIANDTRTCYDSMTSGHFYSFNLTVVTACRIAATRIYQIELSELIVPTSESTTVSTTIPTNTFTNSNTMILASEGRRDMPGLCKFKNVWTESFH